MDKSIRHASHHILQIYSNAGLHFVRRLVSESMLHQLGELLQEKLPSEEAELKEVWFRISPCLNHFANVLRSMSRPQRQKWASLLVEVLRAMLPAPSGVHKTILAAVLLLWQAETVAKISRGKSAAGGLGEIAEAPRTVRVQQTRGVLVAKKEAMLTMKHERRKPCSSFCFNAEYVSKHAFEASLDFEQL